MVRPLRARGEAGMGKNDRTAEALMPRATWWIWLAVALMQASSALAQTPVRPGAAVAFEIDPGRMSSGTSTVPRPIDNVAYQWLVDTSTTPVAATRRGSCVPFTPSGIVEFTCQVLLPTLSDGPHTLRLIALPNPAESGVGPGAPSAPFEVTVLIVASPGAAKNLRLVTP